MRADFSLMSDEELIGHLRDGDRQIAEYLCDKYKELVKIKARSMFILGGDSDDLIQEGMIGLFKAVRDYDPGRDASFRTFADLCVSRQMYTAIEASNRKKHAPLNSYVSLYDDYSKDPEDSDNSISGMLLEIAEVSPEEVLIDKENLKSFEQELYAALSPLERQVLDLKLTGMNYTEIARVLGKDDKSIDNALSRIKTKVKKIKS